jgi:hypothetical protein
MSLKNDIELANTRVKLSRLEKRYEELRNDTSENPTVREMTMKSLKGTINQFKEEIARYKAKPHDEQDGTRTTKMQRNGRELQSEQEVASARQKLRLLEESREEVRREIESDEALRAAVFKSLTRLINQLKEEIARYEAHRPQRRDWEFASKPQQ